MIEWCRADDIDQKAMEPAEFLRPSRLWRLAQKEVRRCGWRSVLRERLRWRHHTQLTSLFTANQATNTFTGVSEPPHRHRQSPSATDQNGAAVRMPVRAVVDKKDDHDAAL